MAKKIKAVERPMALIEWLDHCSATPDSKGWVAMADLDGMRPTPIISTGFIVREDKDSIVIAPHVSMQPTGELEVRGEFCILKRGITRRSSLNATQQHKTNRSATEAPVHRQVYREEQGL